MLLYPRVVLAVSCALISAGYAQAPATTGPTTTPVPRLRGAEKQASIAAANGKSATTDVPTTAVGLDQTVITLKDGCSATGDVSPAKNCVSAVTRAQFEELANALQPDMPADSKRNLATTYGRILVFSDAARALHLENDPNIQVIIRFYTDQILAEGVKRHYAEQFAHPSDQQIQAYYDQNSAKYREANLQRIVIPRIPGDGDKPKLSEADELAAAGKLRQRWVAGDDAAKLQQAAYESAGVTGAGTPDVTLGARRPGSLPANQESVFQLKAGEVSQVYSDAAAYYIYKVESERRIPLSDVRDSIVKTLQQQQLQDKLEEIGKSATPVLNDEYFGPAPTPGTPAAGRRPAVGGAPQPGNPPK